MIEDIVITGITDLEYYPSCKYNNYCKQCMDNEVLCISENKPDMESINEIKINISVEHFEIIHTILGPKVIIHGQKNIKVFYTAANSQQSLHSNHWCIPFCEFILLDDLPKDKCMDSVRNIFIGLEHACVKHFNARMIDLSIFYILCPDVEIKKHFVEKDDDTFSDKYTLYNGKCYSSLYSK